MNPYKRCVHGALDCSLCNADVSTSKQVSGLRFILHELYDISAAISRGDSVNANRLVRDCVQMAEGLCRETEPTDPSLPRTDTTHTRNPDHY